MSRHLERACQRKSTRGSAPATSQPALTAMLWCRTPPTPSSYLAVTLPPSQFLLDGARPQKSRNVQELFFAIL